MTDDEYIRTYGPESCRRPKRNRFVAYLVKVAVATAVILGFMALLGCVCAICGVG